MAVRAETARIRGEQILRALVWVQDDPAGAPGLERVAKAPALEIYFRSPLEVAPHEVACDLMIPLE